MSTTKTKVSFESLFEDQFLLSPLQAISEFRTEVDPHTTYFEYRTEFTFDKDDLPEDKIEEIEESFLDWQESAESNLNGYQKTLMEKHAERDIWDELDLSPDHKSDKLSNYKVKTVVSFDINKNDEEQITSRDVWDRTSGFETDTIVLTEYGSFNPATTNRAHAAWMRVRKTLRQGIEWISVGSIQINMSTGEFYCGVSRCKFSHTLNANNGKEAMEWQIILLLEHLGEHAPKGDISYPYPKILDVKAIRDSDSYKAFTHFMQCKNRNCNHGYLTL